MKRNRMLAGSLENLESRQMMAGDVDAFAISRILYLQGDTLGNGVALVDGGGGNINVVGLNQAGSATTINNGASQTFTKIKDIVITMGKGDDAIVVSNIFVNGALFIQSGLGNDVVGLGAFEDSGLVDDAVDALLGALTIKNSVTISTDVGDDTVIAENATINKMLTLATGLGNDTVRLESHGNPGDVDYVPGVTVLKSVTISTSLGNDILYLERLAAKSLDVTLSNGNDSVTLEKVAITKTANLNGDTDNDTYTDLGGNTFGKKLIRKNFETIV